MSAPRLSVWPPLPIGVYARRPTGRLPFPLAEPGCRLFALARHGLWHGLRGLGLAPGDEVLAPAYHHGSEIETLSRAGLRCRFYEATGSLEPDRDELEALLGPRVRALHLTHHLGFPRAAPGWRRWCDERGLLLIEDAAQAWLSTLDGRPVGSFGQLAIFSLYKTFGLPDGGALISTSPPPAPRRRPRLQAGKLARRHREWLAQRWPRLARPPSRPGPDGGYDPARDFALGDPDRPPSYPTRCLLRRVADERAAARRRSNYLVLLGALRESVPPPFDTVSDGASPMAFPVRAPHKEALLARLAALGVVALDLWSVPHPSLPVERFPGAASRRAGTIGLPVHQELRPAHLDRIVEAVGRDSRPAG